MPSLATCTAFAALVLLAFAVPAHGAYTYGSIVDKNDYDFQQAPSVRGTVPAASKFVLPCFVDEDGNARLDRTDPLYLAIRTGAAEACDEVRTKDLRITAAAGHPAGSNVKPTDADHAMGLRQLGAPDAPLHAIRVFNDVDAATTVRKTDTVYLDAGETAGSQAGVGDIRLSPFGDLKAGTRVQAGDPDHNLVLQEMNGGDAKSLYTANMLFEFGKGWYLNVDLDAAAGGAVEEGDLRLTAAVPNPFADIPANVGDPGKVVDGLALPADVVLAGAPFQLHIVVKNPTAKVGSALVETRLDGVLVDARGTPTLAKGQAATLVVTLLAPTAPGQHKVQAGETTAFFEVQGAVDQAASAMPRGGPAEGVGPVPQVQEQGAPALSGVAPMAALGLALLALRRLA